MKRRRLHVHAMWLHKPFRANEWLLYAQDTPFVGGDHPDPLTSRNNLADAYRAVGDLGRAISLLEQTLANCERVLGASHPLTKTVRENLEAARSERP